MRDQLRQSLLELLYSQGELDDTRTEGATKYAEGAVQEARGRRDEAADNFLDELSRFIKEESHK